MLETEFWRMTAMSVDRSNGKFFLALLSGVVLSACSPSASTAVPPVFAAAPPSAAPPANAAPVAPLVTGLPDFTGLVERYGPAVVNVKVNQKPRASNTRMQQQDPEAENPFNEFFRQFGLPNPRGGGGQQPQPRPSAGEGSGFVVSADGYIITNAHVVRDATDITVKLTDRREYPAKLIGLDTRTDVAVIKIEGKELPTVRIGDPSKIRPGQWVVAIGSPFGMDNSVTAGIVSATLRTLPDEGLPFIQTDVAVNPGNSGGPLFNLNGEVIGINSQIYSQSGGYMGLSFAIPIDIANDVREQLVSKGRVTRSKIGVQLQPGMTADLADSFGLDRPRGALVQKVLPGDPAEKAGILAGDVILAVDGKPVESDVSLPTMISQIKPGTSTELDVWTDKKLRKVTVRVVELKEEGTAAVEAPAKSGGNAKGEPAALGLSVRPLSSAERQNVETQGSLVIENVEGPAADAGIRPGDIILGVAGARVKTLAELQAAVKRQQGRVVALNIQRGDREVFIPVPKE
jgi:serine protease Do